MWYNEFTTNQNTHKKELFVFVDIITQNAWFRQRVIKYSEKKGVTNAASRYRLSRKTVHKWLKLYDGTIESLKDRSRRPKTFPNAQSAGEIKIVKNAWIKDKKGDKLVMWYNACQKGYNRCYGTFLRTVKKLEGKTTKKRKKKKIMEYQRAEYPGQKIQIDVKYVPSYCVANGNKYYQFTAIDECTRMPYRQMYDEHSTYSAREFLLEMFEYFKFPIREVQTDNGCEFTNTLSVTNKNNLTLFEACLADSEIKYHRIRIATPRHNGKVERQHRKDEQRFYRKMRMYDLEDGRRQLKEYQKKSIHYPVISLGFKSPAEMLEKYIGVM